LTRIVGIGLFRDEDLHVERAVRNVFGFCDELILVDHRSRDGTHAILARLAAEHPDRTVVSLDPLICPCSTMFRIDEPHLAWCLDSLRRGEVDGCEQLLGAMEDIYSLLVTLDYPDALTGGLRRTTDSTRGILERTRGDLTLALRQEELVAALRGADRTAEGA
jgi:translin